MLQNQGAYKHIFSLLGIKAKSSASIEICCCSNLQWQEMEHTRGQGQHTKAVSMYVYCRLLGPVVRHWAYGWDNTFEHVYTCIYRLIAGTYLNEDAAYESWYDCKYVMLSFWTRFALDLLFNFNSSDTCMLQGISKVWANWQHIYANESATCQKHMSKTW